MKYDFTLILKDTPELTEDLADALFAAGFTHFEAAIDMDDAVRAAARSGPCSPIRTTCRACLTNASTIGVKSPPLCRPPAIATTVFSGSADSDAATAAGSPQATRSPDAESHEIHDFNAILRLLGQ